MTTTTTSPKTQLIEHLAFTTSKVIGARARIGVIVLATDYTLEHELRRMITLPGVDIYHARIANSPEITPETLAAMRPLITQTAELLLPGDTLDVLAFACTSASMVLGTDVVAANLNAAKPEAKTTNPAAAAFAALRALGAKRIAVLTPYTQSVNAFVQKSVEAAGFEVPVFGSFNEANDPTVAAIDSKSLENAIAKITSLADVDAVFVSCTSVRIADALAAIERKTGVAITSSNHALAWHCLRLAGINDKLPHLGKLFELP
jgi:maleate isomerase